MKIVFFFVLFVGLIVNTLAVNPWQGVKDPMRFRKVIKCPAKRPTDCSKVKTGGIPACGKDAQGLVRSFDNSCEPCKDPSIVSYTKGFCVMA
jgi:hypothetical protein